MNWDWQVFLQSAWSAPPDGTHSSHASSSRCANVPGQPIRPGLSPTKCWCRSSTGACPMAGKEPY